MEWSVTTDTLATSVQQLTILSIHSCRLLSRVLVTCSPEQIRMYHYVCPHNTYFSPYSLKSTLNKAYPICSPDIPHSPGPGCGEVRGAALRRAPPPHREDYFPLPEPPPLLWWIGVCYLHPAPNITNNLDKHSFIMEHPVKLSRMEKNSVLIIVDCKEPTKKTSDSLGVHMAKGRCLVCSWSVSPSQHTCFSGHCWGSLQVKIKVHWLRCLPFGKWKNVLWRSHIHGGTFRRENQNRKEKNAIFLDISI